MTYNVLYQKGNKNFENLIANLPADEKQEIYKDLQNKKFHDSNILKQTFHTKSSLDTFIEVFQSEGRLPGLQDIIILPRPEVPSFIKTDEMI